MDDLQKQFAGDGEGYLAACFDRKMLKGKVMDLTNEECEAKISLKQKQYEANKMELENVEF